MPMEVDTPMESVGMVGGVEGETAPTCSARSLIRMIFTVWECQQGRVVSGAPRRSLKARLLEVQVDFMFLGTVGSHYKFLLFRHCFSGLLGVAAVSENG